MKLVEDKLPKKPTLKQLQDVIMPAMNRVMATVGDAIITKKWDRATKTVNFLLRWHVHVPPDAPHLCRLVGIQEQAHQRVQVRREEGGVGIRKEL